MQIQLRHSAAHFPHFDSLGTDFLRRPGTLSRGSSETSMLAAVLPEWLLGMSGSDYFGASPLLRVHAETTYRRAGLVI